MLTLTTLGTLAGAVAAVTAAVAVGCRFWPAFGSPLSILVIAQGIVLLDGLETQRVSGGHVLLWVINGIVVAAAVLGVRNGVTTWMKKPR